MNTDDTDRRTDLTSVFICVYLWLITLLLNSVRFVFPDDHDRAAEVVGDEHGVVELTKSGREVHCRLRRTTACAVWLALHSLQEHRRLLQAEGVTGALATSLSQTLSRCDCSGLQALALLEPETPEAAPAIVLMACDEQGEELQRRFTARSHAVDQRIEVQAYTADQVATLSATQRREWVVRGCALYGEQRFWQLTLQPTV